MHGGVCDEEKWLSMFVIDLIYYVTICCKKYTIYVHTYVFKQKDLDKRWSYAFHMNFILPYPRGSAADYNKAG